MNTPRGLSDTLCRHIANTPFEALPAATRTAAGRVLLDACGVMLGASGLSPEVTPFVDLACTHGAGGRAVIMGRNTRVSAPWAALANGAMAHALDYEDAFDPAPSHPNAAAVPAAMALAQAAGPVGGREFVTALAIGCDLVCRLGLSLRTTLEERGWYPPPILGAFGATAVAARVLGLSADKVRDALSLTLCQVTAPGEIKDSARSVVRAVREAFPAQSAVTSALLARGGVNGFEAPLEGQAGFFRLYADSRFNPGDLLEGLGESFHIERLSFKPWPACRGTHATIDLALRIAREHEFGWRDIEQIGIMTGSVQRMLIEPVERKRRPETSIDAKFSLPFTVALAFVRGRVGLDDFVEASLSDPDVLSLAARTYPLERPDWGREMASAGGLAVYLRGGRIIQAESPTGPGHPDRPLSTETLIGKFVDCAQRAANPLDSRAARSYADRLLNAETAADAGMIFQ